ncbi:MAG: hypothetical protein H6868_05160 [Rhodospirillales bacterium]|nr:hypothetical protein [Rhodospirillales bacterium]
MPETDTENPVWEKSFPYERSLRSWLHALAEARGQTPAYVQEKLEQTIRSKGAIISPDHLENRLLLALADDGNPARRAQQADVLNHLRNFMADLEPPEHLTGWRQKPIVPRMVGLTALQSRILGQPAALVKLDITNMGGTNNLYKQLLKQSKLAGISRRDAEQQAKTLTDRATRILTAIIADNFGPHIVEKARSGGDEAMLAVSGLNRHDIESRIKKIEKQITTFVKEAGLNEHPHGKEPHNRRRRGYGGALDYVYLPDVTDAQSFGEESKKADKQISLRKRWLGQKQFESLSNYDRSRPGISKDRLSRRFGATAIAQDSLKNAEAVFKKWETAFQIKPEDRTAKHPLHTLQSHHDFHDYPSRAQLQKSLFREFIYTLSETSPALENMSPHFKNLLMFRLSPYPGIDHATNALMGHDLPALAVVNTKIALQHWHAQGRDPQATISALGLNIHNLGGFNALGGQDNADKLLGYVREQLIDKTLSEMGIDPEHVQIAHYGGGQFVILGFPPVKPAKFDVLSERLQKKVTIANNMPLSQIIGHGYPGTLGTVKSDKPDRQKTESGLNITVIRHDVLLEDIAANKIRIGRFVNDTYEAIDQNISALRDSIRRGDTMEERQQLMAEARVSSTILPPDSGDTGRWRYHPAPESP